jgi:hypothetical protein
VARNNTESRIFPRCRQAPGLFTIFTTSLEVQPFQSSSSMCSPRPGLPSNFNPVRSLSLFLVERVRGQARPSHQSEKRTFLACVDFAFLAHEQR